MIWTSLCLNLTQEKFDEEYKAKDPLIKEFIETFRK